MGLRSWGGGGSPALRGWHTGHRARLAAPPAAPVALFEEGSVRRRAQHASPVASATPTGDASAPVGMEMLGDERGHGCPPKSSRGCSQPLEPSHADAATVSGAVTGVPSPPSRPPPRAAALAPRCGGESRHIALPAGWCRAWPHVPAAFSLLSPLPSLFALQGGEIFLPFRVSRPRGGSALADLPVRHCPTPLLPRARAGGHRRRLHPTTPCRDARTMGKAVWLSPCPTLGVFSPQRAQGGWIHLWCKAGVGRGAGWSGSGHGGVEAAWKTHGGAVPGLFLAGNSRFPWHREGPQAGDGAAVVVTPPRCPLHL